MRTHLRNLYTRLLDRLSNIYIMFEIREHVCVCFFFLCSSPALRPGCGTSSGMPHEAKQLKRRPSSSSSSGPEPCEALTCHAFRVETAHTSEPRSWAVRRLSTTVPLG